MKRYHLAGAGLFATAMALLAAMLLLSHVSPNPLELRELLRVGDFDALERKFVTAQARYRSGDLAETISIRTYYAFYTSDPDLAPELDKWVAARPGTWPPLLARGLYRANAGWLARGKLYGRYTPDGNFVEMRTRFARSRQDLTAALALNPYLTTAHAALIAMAKTDTSGGSERRLLDTALETNPASFAIRISHLMNLQPKWGGSWEVMRNFTVASLARISENPDLRYLYAYLGEQHGKALYRSGDYDDAIAEYAETLAEVESSSLYFGRGRAYMALGDYRHALADMNRGLELRPYSETGLMYRARVFMALGRMREAFRDFDLAVRIDPLDVTILLARALALDRYHRFDEALGDIDNAMIYGSHDPAVWIRRGRLYADGLGGHKRAISDFRKAIELQPGKTSVWWYFGSSLAALDRCEAIPALQTYRRRCDAASWCQGNQYPKIETMIDRLVTENGCPRDQ